LKAKKEEAQALPLSAYPKIPQVVEKSCYASMHCFSKPYNQFWEYAL
jgi:hypothetical protein